MHENVDYFIAILIRQQIVHFPIATASFVPIQMITSSNHHKKKTKNYHLVRSLIRLNLIKRTFITISLSTRNWKKFQRLIVVKWTGFLVRSIGQLKLISVSHTFTTSIPTNQVWIIRNPISSSHPHTHHTHWFRSISVVRHRHRL